MALTFTDVTAAAGVAYQQGPPHDPLLGTEVTSMTGGAAAGDYDGDGLIDLFVTRTDNHDLLYRNRGDGTFEDVTAAAFGPAPLALATNGAAWADIDNDGDQDLYVTAVGEERHQLYVNDNGSFSEAATPRGAAIGGPGQTVYGTGVAFGDYDRDGYLDAFVAEWRPIQHASPIRATLLRNRGATQPGHFDDVTIAEGASVEGASATDTTPSYSFSPRFTDLDGDREPDLLVASDFGTSRLFWNRGDAAGPRFVDGTVAAGVHTGLHDMGSTVGDVNGDGLLDWFVTDIYFEGAAAAHPNGNRLFLNQGDRTFADATDTAGVRNGDWGWGAALADLDNDGDLDLTMTNGFQDGDQFQNDPMRLWENDGTGAFTEVAAAAGLAEDGQGRGLLTFDYDNDGDLDLFVVNNGGTPALLRNDTDGANGFLKIKTIGVESNRDGIGTRLVVTADAGDPDSRMVREIDAGTHYLSQSDTTAHFGLGSGVDAVDEVLLLWPSGLHQRMAGVPADASVAVTETPADFNGDGLVDAADYTVWRDSHGTTGDLLPADANADGVVDAADYDVWRQSFGQRAYAVTVTAAGAAVPEPSTMAAALLTIGLSPTRRRRTALG